MLDLEGELHTAPFLELNITVWKHFKYNLSLNVWMCIHRLYPHSKLIIFDICILVGKTQQVS